MKQLSLVLTAFLALTIALALTAFQITNDKIFGTYNYSVGCCGDYFSSILTLDKKLNFKKKYSASSFEYSWAGTISGTWTAKGDTVVLIPTTITQRKGETYTCSTYKMFPDSVAFYSKWLCNPDTLVYKDKTLWSLRELKSKNGTPLYKRK